MSGSFLCSSTLQVQLHGLCSSLVAAGACAMRIVFLSAVVVLILMGVEAIMDKS
jgi:hypothetical protein